MENSLKSNKMKGITVEKFISNTLRVSLLGLIMTVLTISVFAQSAERVWNEEGVWAVSYIETKPGHFNDYIADLSNVWRKYLEEQKKEGMVKSYKMLNVQFTRDGEPNLMLLVEYPNWASFDRGQKYFEELSKRLQGSMKNAQQANIKREELRSLRGSLVAREISFKK